MQMSYTTMTTGTETVSSDGTRVDINRFGYNYSHLDRNARLSDSRSCALTSFGLSPDFMDDGKLKQDGREYFSYYCAKLNQALLKPQDLLYKKIWIEKQLVHVGNTSFVVQSIMKSPDRSSTLVDAKYASVHVDRVTRKKRELPVWFKEKYGHIKQKPVFFVAPDMPRDWCCKFRVQASDTDENNHTNFASYIQFCQNAVYKYQKGKSDVAWLEKRSLEEIELSYLGESLQGEELTVYLLESSENQGTFYVNVEKDGEAIVKTRLKYSLAPSLLANL